RGSSPSVRRRGRVDRGPGPASLCAMRLAHSMAAGQRRRSMAMVVEPSAAPLGAAIRGADLAEALDTATVGLLEEAVAGRQVGVFGHQRVDEEAHIQFSRRFGELEIHVLKQYLHPRHPEILLISNIIEDGRPIGVADAGQYWHSDLSYVAAPSRCS